MIRRGSRIPSRQPATAGGRKAGFARDRRSRRAAEPHRRYPGNRAGEAERRQQHQYAGVKRQMERAQKSITLNEKLKAIQKELGRGEKSESTS